MTENKRYIARDESIINMETGELVNAFDEWAAEIVVDWLNELSDENEQLKQDNNALIKMLENQSVIIQELHSKTLEYELKEPIVLTKEDMEIMGKAISYYLR